MPEFWRSSGYDLLDRRADGMLGITDAFLAAYLARPEMAPLPESCAAERALHAALLADPRRPVTPVNLVGIRDKDARENYGVFARFRDWLVRHETAERAYLALFRAGGVPFPALFVDQAYADARGKTSIIPAWVAAFGDQVFHHVAVRVEDIDRAVNRLKTHGVEFAGNVVGPAGGQLRQIFSAPEMVGGQPFTVLELAERHRGYLGFLPPQADSLMKSTAPR